MPLTGTAFPVSRTLEGREEEWVPLVSMVSRQLLFLPQTYRWAKNLICKRLATSGEEKSLLEIWEVASSVSDDTEITRYSPSGSPG